MSNYASLKATINANVKTNGNQEITGSVMNSVLNAMVNTLGAGYQFMGMAVPATSPGTPDSKVFYLATTPGTYTNFNGLVVSDGEVVIFRWDSAWHKDVTGCASARQVSGIEAILEPILPKIDNTIDVQYGTNRLDPAACIVGYINKNTGEVGSYSERYASDFIPVSQNGLYCNAYNGYGVAGGNAVYDAQKRFLRGFSSAAYTYQPGDAYVRWTLDKAKVETPTAYCIEGTSAGSYTPYSAPTYAIKMEALPDYISQIPELINDVGDFEPTNEDIIISNWVNGGLTSGAVIGYQANNTRLIGTCQVSAGEKFNFECQSGWSLSIRLLANELFDPPTTVSGIVVSTDVLLATNGWVTSGVLVAPEGTKSAVILMRRDTNDAIAVSEASNASFWTFTDETIAEAIKNIKEEIKTEEPAGYYAGEKISLGEQFPFRFNLWKSFGLTSYAQSLAIHGDYIVFFRTSANASLWRISSGEKIADLVFSYGQNSAPHGNVLCFGNEFYPGNTDLPLLYLSQWDGDGGCLVYNVDLQGNTTLVQVINASGIDADTYGSSLGDWVIDNADNSIYSVKYHLNDSLPSSDGNYDNICKFDLPKLNDGDNIILTQEDVKDHFSLPYTPILQDKKISQGRLFMAAGNRSYPGSQKIFVVDLHRKGIIATFDVYPLGRDGGDEPEGLALIEEGLVLGLGYEPTSFYLITTF